MIVKNATRNSDGREVTAYENGRGFDIWAEVKDGIGPNADTMTKIGWVPREGFKLNFTEAQPKISPEVARDYWEQRAVDSDTDVNENETEDSEGSAYQDANYVEDDDDGDSDPDNFAD